MTTLKEAAAMALDALDAINHYVSWRQSNAESAIEALRAALSAPADVPALPDAVDHYGLIDERSPADRAKLAAHCRAAPVQKGAPTDAQIVAAARALNKRHAELCNVNEADSWNIQADDFKADAIAALTAAGIPAPTTDTGEQQR